MKGDSKNKKWESIVGSRLSEVSRKLIGKRILIRKETFVCRSPIMEVTITGISPSGRYVQISEMYTRRWIDGSLYIVLEVLE